MTRPFYESESDRSNEAQVAALISEAWRCEVVKIKRAYVVDYALMTDRRCRALCEIKVRSYSMEALARMGGFMLSLHKYTHARALAAAARVLFVIVVHADDEVWWHGADGQHDGVTIGGRMDRNDAQDIEPVVMLRPERFQRIRRTVQK
jgi:hypothetical protein